jgi:hypothetical protein
VNAVMNHPPVSVEGEELVGGLGVLSYLLKGLTSWT